MLIKMYSIQDTVAAHFQQPFMASTEGHALRAVKNAVNDQRSEISSNPSEYVLYETGEFCTETGKVYPRDSPKLITNLSMLVDPEQQLTDIENDTKE